MSDIKKQFMKVFRCPRCSSEEDSIPVKLIDRGDNERRLELEIEVLENPKALLFKGVHTFTPEGVVCCFCGHVEIVLRSDDLCLLRKIKNYRKVT